MALLERKHSAGGRSSRASKMSDHSRIPASQPGPSAGDMFSNAAPGVLSMLKTSTDVGDLGDFSVNTGRLPAALRPAHRRRNHPAHLSGSSIHTTRTSYSQISKRTSNAQNAPGWDSVSAVSSGTGRHGSMVSLPTPYDGRGPPSRGHPRSSPYGPPGSHGPDGRSYSLTQPHPPLPLKQAKSATSLRSQGQAPFPPQRPPHAYPPRPQRPGYRAPSPALSDSAGAQYQMAYGSPQGFGEDPRYPTGRFPGSHGPSYGPSYNYPQRPPPGPPLVQPHGFGPGPQFGRGMHRPPMPSYNSDYPYAGPPMPRYPGHPPPVPRQLTPVNTNEPGPFGYQGPLTRSRPLYGVPGYGATPRLGTPQIDSMPSSSEPGSSAPTSSNPPTPKDIAAVRVALDPALVDPAYNELQDDQIEYHGIQSYLKYADKSAIYELDSAEPAAVELETNPPSVRGGFVRRIKNLLEDRAAGQENLTSSSGELKRVQEVPRRFHAPHQVEARQDVKELPTNKRSSIHEPYELEAPARITRTLIKANTAPSSSEQNTTTSLVPEDTVKAQEDGKCKPTPAQLHLREVEDMPVSNSSHGEMLLHGPSDEAITSTRSRVDDMDFAIRIQVPDLPVVASRSNSHRKQKVAEQSKEQSEPDSGSVSPMRSEEKVVRDSIVSPMPTQTITAFKEQQKLSGSCHEEVHPHGSPPFGPLPNKALDNSEMISGFSLPPDPSQVHDFSATTYPATDLVADVAVKFSVPRTSDHGKAHLVNMSSLIESPTRSPPAVRSKMSADGNILQDSFSSIEKVAPLHIKKLESLSPARIAGEAGDLSSFIRRSFPRKKSMWPAEPVDSARLSDESTTELGISSLKLPHARLSGLKEDSKEDMSLSNMRSSTSGLRHPTAHALYLQPGHEKLRHSEDISRTTHLTSRTPRMTLSELKNLPSLNFSRMDLIDKLNEALDMRTTRASKSLEVVTRKNVPSIHSPLPLRPASTDTLRERYTSFFNKPEEFELSESSQEGVSRGVVSQSLFSGEDNSTEDARVAESGKHDVRRMETASNYALDGSSSRSIRPMSSEKFLSVASEANRLSVPSVAALSMRLSELLPSIKHLNLDSVIGDDKALNDTIDEIHHLGHHEQRPESDATGLVRSSTGLRQMAAAADNIATNGTHDSAFIETKNGRLMKELPPLPEDTEAFSLSDSGLDRNTTLGTEALSSTAELEIPKPALLRRKSLSVIDDKDEELHPGFTPKRVNVLSSQSLRPWNLDENYPWCGNSPTINITFPSPVLHRKSSISEINRNSNKTSSRIGGESEETGDTGGSTEPRSTLPSSTVISSGETVAPVVLVGHGRKTSKKSLIGSLSRRIGLKSSRSHSRSVAVRESIAHNPGDRYPYTGLQPPNNFNIDEVRSFFSDSTSEGRRSEQRSSFRKRISSFRARLPNTNLTGPYLHSVDIERGARSLDHHGPMSRANASGSLFDYRLTEPVNTHNYDGMVGMGRMEFRVKRVAERLRHIWAKSGKIFRSFSQRNRPVSRRESREREVMANDWLADSLYSGV